MGDLHAERGDRAPVLFRLRTAAIQAAQDAVCGELRFRPVRRSRRIPGRREALRAGA